MESTAFRVYRGPSIYSWGPVIRYTLPAAPARSLGREPRLVADSLFALLPGLREHPAPCDVAALLAPGNDGSAFAHLFEHLCIELQNLTGTELGCVNTEDGRIARDGAVIPYDDESVGLEAGRLSLELIKTLSPNIRFEFESRLQEFIGFAERRSLPAQDRALVHAAQARGIPVIRIVGRIIQFGHGCHLQRLNGTESSHTTMVGNDLAANKDYARRLFQAVGLPVPAYERVYGKDDAVAAAKRIGYPVVVKPNGGNMGAAVSVGMKTDREVRDAFERTRKLGRSALVEQYIPGADYRMLVINGKLVAASRRVPAHVVGDGVRTIEALVHRANQDPRRRAAQRGQWTQLEFDDQSDQLLAELGYQRASIPRDGEIVYLKRIANTSAGGTAVDVTDQVHPENREIAERAATTIGLDVAGVDLLVEDITQPLRAQGGVICEINTRPGIRKHLWPAEGQPRDVVGPIVDMLYPPGSPSRIPIAVVTGSGDTHGAARMLADLLGADGSTVGLAAHDGVFINGKRADGGGMEGWSATRMLLLDPTVEMAVLEVHPADALRYGLGYDWADACAVINQQPIEQPDLVDALRLVVTSARSHVFLSGEQAGTHRLKPHPAARVWRVGADGDGAVLCAKALAACLGSQRDDDIEARLASLSVTRVQ